MPKTESEQLFEQFCAEHGLRCEPIPRAGDRTPDYNLYVASQQIVVEVKQVDPSPGDAEKLARNEAGEAQVFGGEAGKRVRQEITDSKKQLRRAKGRFPALLVLYNTMNIHYLDPMFIKLAMYGQLVADITIPANGERPVVEGIRLGGKRMVTEDHNTTLSAVCVLIEDPQGRPTLTFYHNEFAALPFDPDWFRSDRIKHYVLQRAQPGDYADWTPA